MAASIFALLDDIASLMDDVAVTSKVASQKTAAILGDDLAVNAEKATGFVSSRELPVLWGITKGSFLNKIILIPSVFVLNFLFPIAIKIILVAGGFYLAFEGVEKIIEYLFHKKEHPKQKIIPNKAEEEDIFSEKKKIKNAIKTDFILSIEIVIISLSAVLEKQHPLLTQIMVVTLVSFLATIGVYGIVALIVRMDDAGFRLVKVSHNKGFLSTIGKLLINLLPLIIKALSIIGTIALVMVSGGIFMHNIEYLHHLLPHLPSLINEIILGLAGGFIAIMIKALLTGILRAVKRLGNKA